MAAPAEGRWERWILRLGVPLLILVIMQVQIFYTTSGHMYGTTKRGAHAWWGGSHYYNALADGFVKGEVSLAERPSADLTSQADPYDPAQNSGRKLHDAILFKGADGEWRYYLYWGPVPAALVAVVKLIAGTETVVHDQHLTMLFSCMTLLSTALIFLWIRRHLIPETPLTLLFFVIAMAGLLPTQLYFIARPMVYEASIQGGQAFLIAGTFCALLGAGTRVRWVALLLAGLFWAMAMGTRPSLSPAIAVMSFMIAGRVWSLVGIRNWRAWLPSALALGLPLLLALGLWLTYNYARFQDPLEFGFIYQLAGTDTRRLAELGYSSWRLIETNVTSYLTTPVKIIGTFPFITATGSLPELPLTHYVPAHMAFESTGGLLWTSPILYFAVVPLLLAALEWRRRRANSNAEKWTSMMFIVGAVVGILPALTLTATTMRYLMDCLPMLALAAGVGIWQAARPFVRAGRTYYTLAGILWVVSAWTLLVALMFGFTGYSPGAFEERNPKLWQKFQVFFAS
ncbi:MAG TPA: hypothetical protein VGN72_05845 [Tepidisphaeraceae bacterium]|nr:hypothetical protein [Tepidisphaeraceae bacterium]